MNTALALLDKAFKINTIPINNNQRSSLIPRNIQIAQSGMNTSQYIKMQMVDDNVGNQYGNGNVVTAPAEGNGNGINGNPIRCYNCRGDNASNCTVKPRKWDAAYLQQQLQIAQKEEAGIEITQEEFEFMAVADAHEETERVKVNCTSEDTLQQASTSGTQSDNAPVYDSDGSTEVPKDENCYDHDIFNMLTHVKQYTDLQTELDRTKEKLENCIIKKEKEYAILWNNWYTKCEECKYDKISYVKAYNDMQQKIERLQAQLGDLKESQVLNYAKENAHLKTTYKNLFDSIKVTQAQTNSIIDSLQKQLYDTIYENAKQRARLFDKVYEQKGATKGTRTNTMFTKQSILGKPPSSSSGSKLYSVTPFPKSSILSKVDKTNALFILVTLNSAPSIRESKVVQTVNVSAPRIFRPNPSKTPRVDNVVLNKPVKKSVRIKPITIVNNTAKTRRPHPRSNSNTDRVPSKSKSSCLSNKLEKIKENHRSLQSSNYPYIKLAIRNEKSKKEKSKCCIIKKENEYAKLWNDWYKKCEECKYDKISYDKAYNDMQQKIERLQAQLGDQKGKSKDTPYVSNTLDPLSQKLENQNVELKFQVLNYAKENDHLKTTYKNLFDSIKVTQAQTKAIIDSLQDKLHETIYENANLRTQLFDKVSEQKDTNKGTRANTKFAKQPILGKPPFSSRPKLYAVTPLHKSTAFPKVDESSALSKPVASNSALPLENQQLNHPKSDKVPFKSKSSCLSNKLEKIEENHRSLQSSNYLDHTSSECNNIKLAIQNETSEVICATCKQCLITTNHDDCVLQYMNGMKSRKKNQSANVSKSANQRKYKPRVWKPKKLGSKERLASPKPSTPRSCLRWSPTGRMFDLKGKIIATSESECQRDCSKSDNACTSNPQEPINKRFPSSTFSMTGCQNWLDTLLIPLLSEYKPKNRENHGDNECDS
ncbi:hypothetical protein Tco_0627057 [Tanacetum coccineum]|uniref:Uncharacterized protein n=1 Tax=Tanacetum coccineum TaxID=301880 RepID=A0ABQ4WLC3_9ASTR